MTLLSSNYFTNFCARKGKKTKVIICNPNFLAETCPHLIQFDVLTFLGNALTFLLGICQAYHPQESDGLIQVVVDKASVTEQMLDAKFCCISYIK